MRTIFPLCQDLLKYTPLSHPDHKTLSEALELTQSFLDEFNMIHTKAMFPAADRAQRRLVRNSFIVELADGHRKLRHLFLFNDVIACAKYKVRCCSIGLGKNLVPQSYIKFDQYPL